MWLYNILLSYSQFSLLPSPLSVFPLTARLSIQEDWNRWWTSQTIQRGHLMQRAKNKDMSQQRCSKREGTITSDSDTFYQKTTKRRSEWESLFLLCWLLFVYLLSVWCVLCPKLSKKKEEKGKKKSHPEISLSVKIWINIVHTYSVFY